MVPKTILQFSHPRVFENKKNTSSDRGLSCGTRQSSLSGSPWDWWSRAIDAISLGCRAFDEHAEFDINIKRYVHCELEQTHRVTQVKTTLIDLIIGDCAAARMKYRPTTDRRTETQNMKYQYRATYCS